MDMLLVIMSGNKMGIDDSIMEEFKCFVSIAITAKARIPRY